MRTHLFLCFVFGVVSSMLHQEARGGLLSVEVWTAAAPADIVTITDWISPAPFQTQTPTTAPDTNNFESQISANNINSLNGYVISGFNIQSLSIIFAESEYLTTLTDQTTTISSTGVGTLHIRVTQTLVADPGDIGSLIGVKSTLSASQLTTTDLSVSFTSSIDGVFTSPLSISTTTTVENTEFQTRLGATYTLVNELVFTSTGTGGTASITATTEVSLPEPASLAVWGLFGLAGAGGAWRRRRKAVLAA